MKRWWRTVPFGRAKVDELVELMTETMCSAKRTISVGGEPYPAEVVKARLCQLENRHILYALTSMKETTSEIRNIRGYLLTVLCNAPTTIENDFQAYFNHDFYFAVSDPPQAEGAGQPRGKADGQGAGWPGAGRDKHRDHGREYQIL